MIRAEGGDATAYEADITHEDECHAFAQAALAAYGRIDVLHNNVGIGAGDGPPHHLTDESYDRIMDVNLRSMFRMCRAAVPILRQSDHGAIVNISSLASTASAGNLTAYMAGLRPAGQGWTPAEVSRLLFIRHLVERGRLRS